MAQFLSDGWLDDLAQAAARTTAPAELALVVQVVVDGETGTPVTDYSLRLSDGAVTVGTGRAHDADITLTQDRETATAIARGELSAQVAFMAGRLRVGGDLHTVLRHAGALAAMADIFAEVRDRTTW